ncbi:hypothetical protein NEIELOOT_01961, partial [Neisseria elongata subsp. glycolytica ATCC 29315]
MIGGLTVIASIEMVQQSSWQGCTVGVETEGERQMMVRANKEFPGG